jgi:uncharacterized membrane protein
MMLRKLWPSGVALVMIAVAAAVAWSWRGDLPDRVASHWGSGAATPDRFTSLGAYVLTCVVMVVLLCGLFGALGWFWGGSAVTRRLVAAACVWAGGLGAALLLFPLGAQRGLRDAAEATMPAWTLVGALLLPLIPAVAAGLLERGDPHDPAPAPVAADAERIDLAGGERAVWIGRADGGPGLVIGGVVTVSVALLAVAARQWGLLVLPVLLAVLFVMMFGYTVRVDRTGLTVRSLVGWPRVRVPADEVERAAVTEVHPMRQFGGWGWRVGRDGRVGVVLRAGDGLLVERTGNRSFVVTVDDAGTAAALLNTLADRARR